MRVLAVVEYFPPVLGHDLRIYELARRLPPSWDIWFLVAPSLRMLMEAQQPTDETPERPDRVVPIALPLPRWLRGIWAKSTGLPFAATCLLLLLHAVREAKRIRPDVILANYPSPYTGLLAYAVSRVRATPYVVDFCDDIVSYFEDVVPSRSSGHLARRARSVQDFLIRQSDILPVVTRALWGYAIQRGVDQGRIELLPNGVDLELFQTRAGDGLGSTSQPVTSFRCFYGGSLDAWSGAPLLMELARRGENPEPPIELYVAGHPFAEGNSGLPPNLHHLGLLEKEDLARALQECDCVLVPMSPGNIADAASPVKLFEGLAAGKPCICSRAGGISEVIVDGENGLLVDTLDPEAWLKCIRSLETNPALRQKLSAGARATASRFSWTVLADSFARLLEKAKDQG